MKVNEDIGPGNGASTAVDEESLRRANLVMEAKEEQNNPDPGGQRPAITEQCERIKPTPFLLQSAGGLTASMLKISEKAGWKRPTEIMRIPGMTEEIWLATASESLATVL